MDYLNGIAPWWKNQPSKSGDRCPARLSSTRIMRKGGSPSALSCGHSQVFHCAAGGHCSSGGKVSAGCCFSNSASSAPNSLLSQGWVLPLLMVDNSGFSQPLDSPFDSLCTTLRHRHRPTSKLIVTSKQKKDEPAKPRGKKPLGSFVFTPSWRKLLSICCWQPHLSCQWSVCTPVTSCKRTSDQRAMLAAACLLSR